MSNAHIPSNKPHVSDPRESVKTRTGFEERGIKIGTGATANVRTEQQFGKVEKTSVFDRTVNFLSLNERTIAILESVQQCVSQFMNAVLKKDEIGGEKAVEDLDELSQSEEFEVQVAVAVEITFLSKVQEVWSNYKDRLIVMWDRLYHNLEETRSKIVRPILAAGLGPSEECSTEDAKKFATYARLNAFASYGVNEMAVGANTSPENNFYQLPEEYFIAQSIDLPEKFQIREPGKKLEAGGGLAYSEETGLIKTAEGLKAMLFIGPEGKAVLSFSGTEGVPGKRLIRGMAANIAQNVLGGVPVIYDQAKDLVDILYKKYGENLILTGFSQGGAMAQYAGVSISQDIPIYCMNSAGLEIGVLSKLSETDSFEMPGRNVYNSYLEGELVNSLLTGGIGGILLGKLYKVPVPQDEGRKPWSPLECHYIENLYYALDAQAQKT